MRGDREQIKRSAARIAWRAIDLAVALYKGLRPGLHREGANDPPQLTRIDSSFFSAPSAFLAVSALSAVGSVTAG